MMESITPSDDFTNTVDVTKLTKAVYVAVTADGTAFTITCNKTGTAINFVTGGSWHPIRTRAALAGTGLTFVYAY